jgi:predicted nucleotidyltransferase
LAHFLLRDRDGVNTKEGLVFRVFGYSHPQDAYICDAEYASSKIFFSKDPRAPRTGGKSTFFKFYDDEGWKFVSSRFPQYMVLHEMLGQRVIGVHSTGIADVKKPEVVLRTLAEAPPKDQLVDAMQRSLTTVRNQTGLVDSDFGVFGSMLHGFHNPKFSDIDLIVYGMKANKRVQDALEELYADKQSALRNEFDSFAAMDGKRWRFKNFGATEFVWHQRRKQIYGLFNDAKSGRVIKAEFEPVKAWHEIRSEYDPATRIVREGWAKVRARITQDAEAPFIPSIYGIEPLEVLNGPREGLDVVRIISYMEEFRVQAWKDETVIVEGNLEKVVSPKGNYFQVALTYCPRYYEQALKVADLRI